MSASSGTVMMWARANAFSNKHFFFGHTTVPAFANRIQLYLYGIGVGNLSLGLGNTHGLNTNIDVLSINTWYHIALTWDGTNYEVYVDAISQKSGTYSGLTNIHTSADIGNNGYNVTRTESFDGIIDEVRIYNRVLNQGEIANLAGITLTQCNDNDDNDGNGCADYSGGDTGCSSADDNDESGGTCPTGDVYYIDFSGGNDNNDGLSRATAWKTIPGTTTLATSSSTSPTWITTSYGGGVVSTSNKVPAGTVFRIKPGETWDSAKGGRIWIGTVFYATTATPSNPIKFVADQSWNTGAVTFDGTNIAVPGTGWGLIHINNGVGGIEFDGNNYKYGFVVQDAYREGISCYTTSGIVQGYNFRYIRFYNNGIGYTSDAPSAGQLVLYNVDGGIVDNCEFDGNNRYSNGIYAGETGRRWINGLVSNSIAHDFSGNNDGGIGFKAQNGQITFDNCTAYNVNKGFDLGEQSAVDTWDIVYKVVNSLVYNCDRGNSNGISFSGRCNVRTGKTDFYVINSVSRDNDGHGIYMYAGEYRGYIVHNILDNNGLGGGTWNNPGASISVGPAADCQGSGVGGGNRDLTHIEAYVYNNIGYKPSPPTNYLGNQIHVEVFWGNPDTPTKNSDFDYYGDYNSWVQHSGGGQFARWALYAGGGESDDLTDFSYAEGPGGSGNNWYDWYDGDASQSASGCLGHYQQDANSVTSEPPFSDVINHDYTLTTNYLGTDLSIKSWYIPEMGIDRDGNPRTSWDIGAYEY